MYPQKLDLRRTKEFKGWKEAVKNTNNSEANIIVQTLHTTVSYEENQTNNNEENQFDTEQSYTETTNNNNEENQSDTDESDTETTNNNEKNQSDTDESDTEQNDYHDNMLLQIPLESYLPAAKQDKNTQTTTSDNDTEPPNAFEIPANNYDIEVFSDERLREIVAELRDDPELRNIFAEPENLSDQEDEGVKLRTIEEELEVDIEPFDYRLEVELSNWESHL